MDHHNLLDYPDLNKQFEIHTNNRSFQFGAVIIQEIKLITLYIIKPTRPQIYI